MRVLHLINDLRIGGAERLVCDLAPRLRDLGVTNHVAVLRAITGGSFLEETLVRVDGIPLLLPPNELPLRSPKQIRPLATLMARYDIVHVQLFPAQLWAAIAWSRMPVQRPLLVTSEQNTHNRRRGNPVGRIVDGWMYRHYQHIIAISEGTRDALVKWVPATGPKTTVIPNGANIPRFQNAVPIDRDALSKLGGGDRNREQGVPPDAPLLVCVGRLERQKDHVTLIKALAQLPNVHLALVGTGSLAEQIGMEAERFAVADRVHLLGLQDDVPPIVRAADVYVQPSRWEGFGIAVVEAMAAGRSVVVSDVAGVREVVGDVGIKFAAGDVDQLARELSRLLADAPLRDTLGAEGVRQAQQFSIERCAQSHLELYQSLIR